MVLTEFLKISSETELCGGVGFLSAVEHSLPTLCRFILSPSLDLQDSHFDLLLLSGDSPGLTSCRTQERGRDGQRTGAGSAPAPS